MSKNSLTCHGEAWRSRTNYSEEEPKREAIAKQNPLQHNRSETELHQISPALTGQEKILKNKSKIRLFDLKPNFTQLTSRLSPLKFDFSRLSFLFLFTLFFCLP